MVGSPIAGGRAFLSNQNSRDLGAAYHVTTIAQAAGCFGVVCSPQELEIIAPLGIPAIVPESIAASAGLPPCDPQRLATLQGMVAQTWDKLVANPQRDAFIASVTALDTATEPA